jgi:hypothetical protein
LARKSSRTLNAKRLTLNDQGNKTMQETQDAYEQLKRKGQAKLDAVSSQGAGVLCSNILMVCLSFSSSNGSSLTP